jgi:biofilm protein TabA
MILDNIKNARQYHYLHPAFEAAFQFLSESDISSLEEGKHLINDKCFAIISRGIGVTKDKVKLEAHNDHIDIQFINKGIDLIGWRYREACCKPIGTFDETKDYILFEDSVEDFITVNEGFFAVFYPSDAHAPLAGSGSFEKVVVKVKIHA